MSDATLLLLICASVGHATWNAISRGVTALQQFYTLISLVAVVLYVPVAIHFWMTTRFPINSLGWLCGTISFEIAYFLCLAKAYREGSFLTIYPVARGTAPLMATLFSFLLSGTFVGYAALGGIFIIVIGILLINQSRFSLTQFRATFVNRGTIWALLTGICTASYSVCYSMGAVIMSPILFTYTVYIGLCIGKIAVDQLTGDGPSYVRLFKMYPYRALTGGFLVFGVNAVVVYAMKSTPVALVATVREFSIVFASIIGVLWLKERIYPPKIVAIVLIVTGVLMIRG